MIFEHRHEQGQGMVEYSLIIVLIALVVIVAITLFGQQLSTTFSQITSTIPVH